MATLTKKDLLEAIEDMPMDAELRIKYEHPTYGGDVWIEDLIVMTSIGRRDRGTIVIQEKS